MVGDVHTLAPAGPHNCVPFDVFFSAAGASGNVYYFQSRFPLTAS